MKSHTYWASALLVLALALWCTLGVSAEDTTTTASGTAGSFQLEQVYVNAPELDVYFYATDANGESYSPIVVQAQGVEATLGDRKLDTGMIGVADDPICYIIALDNSTSIDAEDFHKMRTAIWKLAQTKQDKDQIMVYTLAGGAQCALPATNDKAEIFNTLRTIGQSEGAIDLTGTVTMLAADIQTEYQSLAPRKVAFVCTDAAQIMTNLALLGGTLGTDQSNLNMAMYTFICTAAPDQLESTTQMSGGKVIACRHADLAAEMQAKQTKFAQALTLRTEVPDSLTGERQEIFTLSVPKLGSAVKSSTTVYMGFKMEKPQVTKVEPLGRTKLRLTFNQAVNANADRPQYYRVYTNDVWGWYVKIESVQLSEDGRTAVLTTEPLYQGRYNVTLNKVASRMTPANVSARQQSCSFMIAPGPGVLHGAVQHAADHRRGAAGGAGPQLAGAAPQGACLGADRRSGAPAGGCRQPGRHRRTAQALGYTVLGCARLHCREPLGGHCGKQPDLGQRRRPVRPLPAGQPHPPPARRAGRAGRSPAGAAPWP